MGAAKIVKLSQLHPIFQRKWVEPVQPELCYEKNWVEPTQPKNLRKKGKGPVEPESGDHIEWKRLNQNLKEYLFKWNNLLNNK